MTNERWAAIDRVLGAALGREPHERAAFLNEACAGDEPLRREVDSLLAHASAGVGFMSTPALAGESPDASITLIGRRVGPYTIHSLLGRGGMGEVYRAHDGDLGRDVAIKTLPGLLVSDPDRLARFHREARVLASVSHPHVGAIFGLENLDDAPVLVLELVEGETLAERLAAGPLPIWEALALACQIADALDAAHEKGIVHRDLKPANIKITREGILKVLDFGLAKPERAGVEVPSPAPPPAVSPGATDAGLILGTAGYMSPEQARGRPVDKRTDVWAFACVLYEMLTGQAAFTGATAAGTLAAIVERPPDWSRLPAGLPARVHELLRRCLEKDPRNRRRDIADVRAEIDRAASEPAATSVAAAGRRARLGWMVAALLAVALTVTVGRPFVSRPANAPETRVDVTTPDMTSASAFAIAPDGRHLVFVAQRNGQPQLYLRSFDNDTAAPLAGTTGALLPFWKPSGRSIAFFADNQLKRIDLDDGLVRVLTRLGGAQGGSWGPDGTILFAGRPTGQVFRVPEAGGEPIAVTAITAKQATHRFPVFLPDGRRFLFYVTGTESVQGIYLGSLDSPGATRLTEADGLGAYVAAAARPGWLLFVRQGALLARRLDPARPQLLGDPVTVAESVATDMMHGAVSVSASGVIAYRTGAITPRQLTWFDRSGRPLGTLGEPDLSGQINVALSRDGHLRAATQRTVQNNLDVWIIDAARTSRFSFDADGDGWPLWSPEGDRIAYVSNKTGASAFYTRRWNSTDADDDQVLGVGILCDWSRDDRFLLYSERNSDTQLNELWALPAGGDGDPILVARNRSNNLWGQFSPDGRWVAYQSNESGRHEIYVRPFPRADVAVRVSTSGGIHPRWDRRGRELFFVSPDSKLMSASITARGVTLDVGAPVPLFHTAIVGGGAFAPGYRQQFDVAADGRFLINVETDSAPTPITLIQDWDQR